jgi:hypothetical protein
MTDLSYSFEYFNSHFRYSSLQTCTNWRVWAGLLMQLGPRSSQSWARTLRITIFWVWDLHSRFCRSSMSNKHCAECWLGDTGSDPTLSSLEISLLIILCSSWNVQKMSIRFFHFQSTCRHIKNGQFRCSGLDQWRMYIPQSNCLTKFLSSWVLLMQFLGISGSWIGFFPVVLR